MFSFKRNKTPKPIVEADVVFIESPQDKIERAMRESCEEDSDFSARLIEAVKIIQKDRVMMAGDVSCTYADALMALLALVKRSANDDIIALKIGLRNAVDHIVGEGQQFKSQEEARLALHDLRNGIK